MGEDPQDIGRLWQRLWKMNRQASIKAIGALDVYLWDINGKIAGLPIHRLLGTCKHAVPAYSSTAYHETAAAADAEEAMRFKEAGWRAHKLHPHGEPHADIDICRTVREAVGDGSTLMLDSMWAYQYADALRVGRAIEELDYYLRGDVAVTGGNLYGLVSDIEVDAAGMVHAPAEPGLGYRIDWEGALPNRR